MRTISLIQNWTKRHLIKSAYFKAAIMLLAVTTVFYSCKKDRKEVETPPANPPSITGFLPLSGGANTDVTLTGTNFPGTVSVTVNGKPAVVKSSTATLVIFTLQPGTGSGKIVVTGSTGSATSATDFIYNFIVTATTVAGSDCGSIPLGDDSDNGAFLSAKIGYTGGASFDKSGNLLYTELRNPANGTDGTRIRRLNFTTKQVETFATTNLVNGGGGGSGFKDVVVASDGTVYAVNSDFNAIYKFPATGGVNTATLFAGKGTFDNSGNAASADGTGSGAVFNQPHRLTIDESDNLYVVEQTGTASKSKIRKITPAGVVTTIVAPGDLVDIDGKVVAPLSIKFHAGSLYVANFPDGYVGSAHIYKISTDGASIVRYAGGSVNPAENTNASRFKAGTSKDDAIFWYIASIDFDAAGNLYATDGYLGMVYKLDVTTNKVTNLGGAWTADNNATQCAKYSSLLSAGLVLNPDDPEQQPFRNLYSINIAADGAIYLVAGSDDNSGAQKIFSISSK